MTDRILQTRFKLISFFLRARSDLLIKHTFKRSYRQHNNTKRIFDEATSKLKLYYDYGFKKTTRQAVKNKKLS